MSFQIRQTTVDDSVNKTLYIISNDLNIIYERNLGRLGLEGL